VATEAPERITFVAHVTNVTKNDYGWYKIETDGKPRTVDTKRDELAGEAARFQRSGKLARISATPRPPKTLENGFTVQDHWFEGIVEEVEEPLDDILSTIPSEARNETSFNRRTNPYDAWRMALSTGAKLAVDTLPLLQPASQTPEAQQKLALWWATWIFTTQMPSGTPLDEPLDDIDAEFGGL